MYVVYNTDTGWALRAQINVIGDYGLALARQTTPFPNEFFDDLLMRKVPLHNDCIGWSGIIHKDKVPYYYNRYAPGYKHQMPARQLLLCQHLNIDPMCFPPRLKIGMICTTRLCVNIEHMIPYNFYARTKTGDIAQPQTAEIELTPSRQAALRAEAEALRAKIERGEPIEPVAKPAPKPMTHDDIMDILNYKKTK